MRSWCKISTKNNILIMFIGKTLLIDFLGESRRNTIDVTLSGVQKRGMSGQLTGANHYHAHCTAVSSRQELCNQKG